MDIQNDADHAQWPPLGSSCDHDFEYPMDYLSSIWIANPNFQRIRRLSIHGLRDLHLEWTFKFISIMRSDLHLEMAEILDADIRRIISIPFE